MGITWQMLQYVPYIWLKRISQHCGKPYNLKIHLCDDLRFFQHYDVISHECLYFKASTELLFLSTFGHPWFKVGPNTRVKNCAALPWNTKHLVLMWVKIRKKQPFTYFVYTYCFFTIMHLWYVSIILYIYIYSWFPTPPNRWPWLCSSHFW